MPFQNKKETKTVQMVSSWNFSMSAYIETKLKTEKSITAKVENHMNRHPEIEVMGLMTEPQGKGWLVAIPGFVYVMEQDNEPFFFHGTKMYKIKTSAETVEKGIIACLRGCEQIIVKTACVGFLEHLDVYEGVPPKKGDFSKLIAKTIIKLAEGEAC